MTFGGGEGGAGCGSCDGDDVGCSCEQTIRIVVVVLALADSFTHRQNVLRLRSVQLCCCCCLLYVDRLSKGVQMFLSGSVLIEQKRALYLQQTFVIWPIAVVGGDKQLSGSVICLFQYSYTDRN